MIPENSISLELFKHVQLQNTFNRCKVHQILPVTVDYACFLMKCINYEKVMCLEIIQLFGRDNTHFGKVQPILNTVLVSGLVLDIRFVISFYSQTFPILGIFQYLSQPIPTPLICNELCYSFLNE